MPSYAARLNCICQGEIARKKELSNAYISLLLSWKNSSRTSKNTTITVRDHIRADGNRTASVVLPNTAINGTSR